MPSEASTALAMTPERIALAAAPLGCMPSVWSTSFPLDSSNAHVSSSGSAAFIATPLAFTPAALAMALTQLE